MIPEVEFNLERLIELLLEDKRNNPSSYAFVIVSEGASWKGMRLAGLRTTTSTATRKMPTSARRWRMKCSIAPGKRCMVSDLTYDLRSGDPDALDQIVAITLANVAVDLIRDGLHGRLTAVQDGKYTHAPLPDPKLGPRKVDVGKDVQSRPLPAELRRTDRFAPAALRRELA